VLGLELEAGVRPARAWSAEVSYVFIDAHVTEDPMLSGKRVAQDPRQRATASLTYDGLATVTGQLRYTSGQFEDDLNTLPMGAYTVVDLFAQRRVAYGITAFARATNLLDRRYLVGRAGVDTIGAPRAILVGLSFRD
jgi:outer membrane receptor protein involved in Fe transport